MIRIITQRVCIQCNNNFKLFITEDRNKCDKCDIYETAEQKEYKEKRFNDNKVKKDDIEINECKIGGNSRNFGGYLRRRFLKIEDVYKISEISNIDNTPTEINKVEEVNDIYDISDKVEETDKINDISIIPTKIEEIDDVDDILLRRLSDIDITS